MAGLYVYSSWTYVALKTSLQWRSDWIPPKTTSTVWFCWNEQNQNKLKVWSHLRLFSSSLVWADIKITTKTLFLDWYIWLITVTWLSRRRLLEGFGKTSSCFSWYKISSEHMKKKSSSFSSFHFSRLLSDVNIFASAKQTEHNSMCEHTFKCKVDFGKPAYNIFNSAYSKSDNWLTSFQCCVHWILVLYVQSSLNL